MKNRIFFGLLTVATLLCSVIFISGQDETAVPGNKIANEFYQVALDAINVKQYEKARDFLLKTIGFDDKFAEAYAKLGDVYLLLKDNELGYENYRKFIGIIGAQGQPPEELVKLANEIKPKLEKFRVIEEKGANVTSEFVSKIAGLGRACSDLGDYSMAAETFSLAGKIDENNTEFPNLLKQAESEWAALAPSAPETADSELAKVFCDSGIELAKKAKYQEAIEKFIKALSYNNNNSNVFFSLGECYEKTKDMKNAVINYRYCYSLLQKRDPRSKDDEALLAKAAKCLEKLNPNIPNFTKSKNDYMAKANGIARDYISNKYPHLAYVLLCAVLRVDRQNKEADTLLLKIDREVIYYENKKMMLNKLKLSPKGAPIIMFNGKDFTSWYLKMQMNGIFAKDCFSVLNGKMAVIPKNSKHGNLILWDKQLPEICMISVSFYPDKMIDERDSAFFCVLRGIIDNGLGHIRACAAQGSIDKDSLKRAHTYDYIIGPDIHAISLDTEDMVNVGLDSDFPEMKFGILATNLRVDILSVVMQELTKSAE